MSVSFVSCIIYIQSQIPVKCPVSEIIKSRRAQGRECYEVSWEDMDGLETSIVLADLIER
jgi:flap endonuclease GEN